MGTHVLLTVVVFIYDLNMIKDQPGPVTPCEFFDMSEKDGHCCM